MAEVEVDRHGNELLFDGYVIPLDTRKVPESVLGALYDCLEAAERARRRWGDPRP